MPLDQCLLSVFTVFFFQKTKNPKKTNNLKKKKTNPKPNKITHKHTHGKTNQPNKQQEIFFLPMRSRVVPRDGVNHFREGRLRSPSVSTSKEPTTREPCRNTSVQLPPAHLGPFAACPYPLLLLVSSFSPPLWVSSALLFLFYYYFQIIWFLAIYIVTLLSFFSEGRGSGIGGDLLLCSVFFRRLVGREGIGFQPHSMIEV